jgi:methylated-DNA-protein-cysteine methyltransferase related protein
VAPRPQGGRPTGAKGSSGLRARVLAAVRKIPHGRVATYGDIAELARAPGAARAVGNIMSGCDDPSVPCHRVIASAGGLGGFGGYLDRKRQLLRAEGLEVTATRVRGFADVRWPVQPAAARRTPATRRREPHV